MHYSTSASYRRGSREPSDCRQRNSRLASSLGRKLCVPRFPNKQSRRELRARFLPSRRSARAGRQPISRLVDPATRIEKKADVRMRSIDPWTHAVRWPISGTAMSSVSYPGKKKEGKRFWILDIPPVFVQRDTVYREVNKFYLFIVSFIIFIRGDLF